MSEEKKAKVSRPKLTPAYDLLEGAVKVWWKNLMKFIKVYLWGILFILITLFIGLILSIISDFINGNTILPIGVFTAVSNIVVDSLLFIIPFFVIYFIFRSFIGMFLIVKNDYTGKALDTYKETNKYFWSYLWLIVLTIILIILWTLCLIIPGIIFSILYSVAVYAFFFEDLKGMNAVRRSIYLVKDYWWAVFSRFVVIGVVLYIFIKIISIPLYFSTAPQYFVFGGSIFYYFWKVVIQIISFLIGPISLLYFYQIYQDLVAIKK